MDVARGYVAQVERVLAAVAAVFPELNEIPDVRPVPSAGRDVPDGAGGLAAAAADAAGRYLGDDARAVALGDALHREATKASAQALQAGDSARGVARGAGDRARAMLTEGVEGSDLSALVRQMDGRLGAMQEHLDTTRAQLAESAAAIRAQGAEMAAIYHP